MIKKDIILLIGGIFVILVSGVIGYSLHAVLYPARPVVQEFIVPEKRDEVVLEDVEEPAIIEEGLGAVTDPEPEIIKEEPPQKPEEVSLPERLVEEIEWVEREQIEKLGVFKVEKESVSEYYKIATLSDQEYGEGEVILVMAASDGPGFSEQYCRFLKFKDQIVFIERHSDNLYQDIRYLSDAVKVDKNFTIPPLEFPQTIKGPEPGQVLVWDEYAQSFFDPSNLQIVFHHEELGDVYMNDGSIGWSRYGFYIKAVDGSLRSYYLKMDFIGEDRT